MKLGAMIETLRGLPREKPVRFESTKEAPLAFMPLGEGLAVGRDFRTVTTVGTLLNKATEMVGKVEKSPGLGELVIDHETEVFGVDEIEDASLEILIR